MREIASSGGRGAVPMGGGSSSGTPLSRHWDAAYEGHGVAGVSWFQVAPTQSLAYVDRLQVPTDGPVVDIGGGAASLVDHLLERGFVDVSVLDVSRAALDAARQRVGAGAPVSWLHEDLLIWRPERRYVLWHDRAVLHFLVKPEDRDRYLAALRSALVPGGAVIIATFAPTVPITALAFLSLAIPSTTSRLCWAMVSALLMPAATSTPRLPACTSPSRGSRHERWTDRFSRA
jgi:SAM-dependent methyltransferase